MCFYVATGINYLLPGLIKTYVAWHSETAGSQLERIEAKVGPLYKPMLGHLLLYFTCGKPVPPAPMTLQGVSAC